MDRTNRSSRRTVRLGAQLTAFVLPLLSTLSFVGTNARVIDTASARGRALEFFTAPGDQSGLADLPARAPRWGARADTVWYGYVQTIAGVRYAVPGETWTFDHGAGGAEGWYAVDLSVTTAQDCRRIDVAAWAGHENQVPAPIISGIGSAWFGVMEDEADALCWEGGLGYGNNWCQRWVSPPIAYLGSGDVTLAFDYFNDSEDQFDYTGVRLTLANGDKIDFNGAGFTGKIGNPAAQSFAHANYLVPEGSLVGQTSFTLLFEFTSDGGWSDEEGAYPTDYGPFAVDNIVLSGSGVGSALNYDYEADAQGWSAAPCSAVGTFFAIHDLAKYTILDPCECRLAGNVVGLHAGLGDAGAHPVGQHERLFSPPIDKSAMGPANTAIVAEWDQYSILPQANGVFYRPGWSYYPWICPITGVSQWSRRMGQSTYQFTGDAPLCARYRNVATEWGIPGDTPLASFVFEVFASCDAFGIPSSVCSNITNFTPLIDNVRVGVTRIPNAPVISFTEGGQFQDGFGQGLLLATTNAGNADITFDLHLDSDAPDLLGDSLVVRGPEPSSSTKWEARLWWRIRREGPGTGVAGYSVWKNAVRDGLNIVGPSGQFTYGVMDSAQSGTSIYRSRFISEFREDDDDFTGEGANSNEMIRDGILPPGTQIEYFVTSNYVCTPSEYFYLPDTTGGNYLEFEILPSWRVVSGTGKFPCLLTIDLNTGEQPVVESALNVVMNGAGPGDPLPNPTLWDRYDYDDASSSWNAPLARSTFGNNGLSLITMLGYRQVLLYTGRAPAGSMESADFDFLGDWISSLLCNGNISGSGGRQGFMGAGDDIGAILQERGPNFLANYCGADLACDAYHAPTCGPSSPADESACVRLEPATGAAYPPLIDSDLYGNWCPQSYAFDVLTKFSGGVGNRVYRDYDRTPPLDTNYAQITKSVTASGTDNYRTVLAGYALGHLSFRDVGSECAGDDAHIVPAAAEELRAGMRWIFGSDANRPSFCQNPCVDGPTAVEGTPVNLGVSALLGNSPNPFNPRTTLRFALSEAGHAELTIYDVNGRTVRKLVDAALVAGEHTVVWDGTNDLGRKLGAGVYWSQLRAGGYESQKKMILLK
ncbi:MAG: FlgD immunoglobulin-like domain containing protein [Candidatus Eisenbacteria bacterium]